MKSASLRERLSGLAEFAALFRSADFEFGRWAGGDLREPGVRQMPYYALGVGGERFMAEAYRLGWVAEGFDWAEWIASEEAEQLRNDRVVLQRATPDELEKLLTALIRQDRFVEGSLAAAFESGLLRAITERAEVLLKQMSKPE